MKTSLNKRIYTVTALALAFALFASAPLSTAPLTALAATSPGSLSDVGLQEYYNADPANGIYVSPDGNDSTATGSIGAPYKSINAALAAVSPGGTVILRGGTYREGVNVRVRKRNITIKSRQGEWAIIDLSTYNSGHDEDSGVYFDVDSSGGKLLGVEVIGGFYAVCMETKWNWGGDDDWVAASDILIENCKLHDSRYDVVKVKPNCDNITIRNCEIYNSGRAFDGRPKNGEDNAEGIDNVNGDKMLVKNCYIHDIVSNAIYAKGGATDVIIDGNRIETAYGAGIMVGFDTSPEYFDTKVNPQYYESIHCVVYNNLIIGTGWEGIGFYGSKDAQVYNNTLVNVVNSGQYHSAIYFGLTFQDWESYAGRPANVNPSIHHNIVCQPSGIVRPMIEIRYANELGGMSALDGNPVMNNNCYYITGKSAVFTDRRPGRELENAGLAAWQRHISGDAGTIEADPALDAYYLPTNPQCAGMGIKSNAPPPGALHHFMPVKEYSPGQYADVDEDAWYGFNNQLVVARACMYGLMEGNSATVFNPTGNITIAEAITVAARVSNIYTGGDGEFVQGMPWYQVYLDYAAENGIIAAGDFSAGGSQSQGGQPDYNRAATRAEMAYIFSRALPAEEFPAHNTVNSLPDVNNATQYSAAIIMLYKAGVLAGGDNRGTFSPGANITRAEAAAIISRVILPLTRFSGKVYG